MFRLQCQGSIARAAVVVALLSSRPASAQIGVDPGPPREHGGCVRNVIIGVWYDQVNQAHAEKQLQHRQAKLRHHAESGNHAAVDRDLCCIDNLSYRIAIDEWLIRWNSLQNPGFYPIRTNAVSAAAIAQAATPIFAPNPWWPAAGPYSTPNPNPSPYPTSTASPYPTSAPSLYPTPGAVAAGPTTTITLVNAEPPGPGLAFAVNGVAHQSLGGSRQELAVAPNSVITYDSGGSLGQRRYLISAGRYEFRLAAEGWSLYKLPDAP
jgi:hypothetical protein